MKNIFTTETEDWEEMTDEEIDELYNYIEELYIFSETEDISEDAPEITIDLQELFPEDFEEPIKREEVFIDYSKAIPQADLTRKMPPDAKILLIPNAPLVPKIPQKTPKPKQNRPLPRAYLDMINTDESDGNGGREFTYRMSHKNDGDCEYE